MSTNEITVDEKMMQKIARLARLKLSEAELREYTKDLARILGYIEKLNTVSTDGVEPLVHGIPLPTRMREDEAVALPEEETRLIVSASAESVYQQYRVPQVLGGGA